MRINTPRLVRLLAAATLVVGILSAPAAGHTSQSPKLDGGAPAPVVGGAAAPLPNNVTRISGTSRYATAAAFATSKWAPGVPVAYVVTGASYPDALAAAPAAGLSGGPVLLTRRDDVPTETAAALDSLNPGTIVVVGGTAAVSGGVLDALETYAGNGTVTRVAGASRYETAALLSQQMFPDPEAGPSGIFLASGEGFPDALGAAAAAASDPQWPLLLTGRDALPAPTVAELVRLGIRAPHVFVIGGTAAISDTVVSQIDALPGLSTVERIAQPDRYGTAVVLARSFFPNPDDVVVATGTNFPDGLVAGAYGRPLLLVPTGSVPSSVLEALAYLHPPTITVLGGTGAVTDDQIRTLAAAVSSLSAAQTIIGGNISRIAGASRYETAATFAIAAFPLRPPVAYLVTGGGFADALAAGPAAALEGGPVLLTQPTSLPAETADALELIDPAEIVVVGGTGAVSGEVLQELRSHTSGGVTRIAGSNRYETAALVAQRMFPFPGPGPTQVWVASGESFPDALGAAAAAAATGRPLLLTPRDALPPETVEQLTRYGPIPPNVFVTGGTAAVSGAVVNELTALTGPELVTRYAGADRYATAAEVALKLALLGLPNLVVATGTNYPDALVAAAYGRPLLLVPVGSIPQVVRDAIVELPATSAIVLGGTAVITQAQVDSIAALLLE